MSIRVLEISSGKVSFGRDLDLANKNEMWD